MIDATEGPLPLGRASLSGIGELLIATVVPEPSTVMFCFGALVPLIGGVRP